MLRSKNSSSNDLSEVLDASHIPVSFYSYWNFLLSSAIRGFNRYNTKIDWSLLFILVILGQLRSVKQLSTFILFALCLVYQVILSWRKWSLLLLRWPRYQADQVIRWSDDQVIRRTYYAVRSDHLTCIEPHGNLINYPNEVPYHITTQSVSLMRYTCLITPVLIGRFTWSSQEIIS